MIKPLPGGDQGSTLTAQMVLDKISTAYIAGLQRCYRLGQNEDAGLEGKIAIELTVDEHGRVADPTASGLTQKVDSCVGGFMSLVALRHSQGQGRPRDARRRSRSR